MRPAASNPARRKTALGALAVAGGAAILVVGACVRDVHSPIARVPDLVLPPSVPGAPTAPGPFPRLRSFDPVSVNARCEGCHAEIAVEWRASFHRAAYSDPMVQSQLLKEPFAFCRGCHAPEADPAGGDPVERHEMGVGCVTCHVVGDEILAVSKPTDAGREDQRRPPGDRRGDAPNAPNAPNAENSAALDDDKGAPHDGEHHPITRSLAFGGQAACAGCHEFPFPEERQRRDPLLMQTTMTEHARSAMADRSCASCHMPLVQGPTGAHRDHRFAASRDEALVRSAIVVEERPFEGDTLVLRLRPGAAGHAFPTGDMLRRLALIVDVTDAAGKVVAHDERFFARHFEMLQVPNKPPRKVLSKDDRVGAGPGDIDYRYVVRKAPEGGHLRYVLRYERVSDPNGGEDGRALVEGSIVLADRTLPL